MEAQENGNARYQPLYIALAVVIGVSFIGFLGGTSASNYTNAHSVLPDVQQADVEHAVPYAKTYRDMGGTPRGQGAGFGDDVARMTALLPSRTDEVDLSDTQKADALALRASRRAYDGAPPVIPHPVRQRAASECRVCHENGIRIGTHQAPAYPHDSFESCVQCHAMAEPNLPWDSDLTQDPRDVPNSFAGLAEPTEGPRWTDIAPPTIPHKTHMRERCESCHGVTGKDAMRSTHPDRQSCEQCHAPAADLEWRPGGRK